MRALKGGFRGLKAVLQLLVEIPAWSFGYLSLVGNGGMVVIGVKIVPPFLHSLLTKGKFGSQVSFSGELYRGKHPRLLSKAKSGIPSGCVAEFTLVGIS